MDATSVTTLWPRNSSDWYYYDKGGDLGGAKTSWLTGNVTKWPTGKGPLGFNTDNTTWDTFGTTLQYYTKSSLAAYFAKNFTITSANITNTYSLDFNIRRTDGAIVYLNGAELWRTQVPWGPVNWTVGATSYTNTWSGNLPWLYEKCQACFRNTTAKLKNGVNWIAVQLQSSWYWENHAAFDMDLLRNVPTNCSSLPGKPSVCVRQVAQAISPDASVWQYLDGSKTLPASNWMLPSFVSTTWPSGAMPFGFTSYPWRRTTLNPGPNGTEVRRTFYFRKTISIPDAKCFFVLNSTLLVNDGAVLYINGVEVFRKRMPAGPVNSTAFATSWGTWSYDWNLFSGGWLKTGTNVLAAELHRNQGNTDYIFFDWQVMGAREAYNCTPLPL